VIRRAPYLLAAGPLLLGLVFGLLRDIPQEPECGGGGVPPGQVDAYLEGSIPLFALAWAVPAVLYLLALRSGRRTGSVPLVAGVYAAVGGVAVADSTELNWVGAVAGIALALAIAAGLYRLAAQPPTVRGLGLSVGVGIVMVPLGLLLAIYSVFASSFVLPPLVLGGVLAILAARRPERVAAAAAVHAALFVPLLVLIIASRGSGPIGC
jgi:hypothetical protein